MRFEFDAEFCRDLGRSSTTEWVIANGIGGYAMGTVCGMLTRRYHGHLIAAIRPPEDRRLILATVEARAECKGTVADLSTNQYPGTVFPRGYEALTGFSAYPDRVVWQFETGSVKVAKTLTLISGSNTVLISYRNDGDLPLILDLRPLIGCRGHHENFAENSEFPQGLAFPLNETLIEHAGISISISHRNAERTPVQGWYYRFEHQREIERGLNPRDDLYCPCELRYTLEPKQEATLVVSTDGVRMVQEANAPSVGWTPREMANLFLTESSERKCIIAGYPWFTEWGRDSMISLPALCLHSGQVEFAKDVLRSFAASMHKGLVPNRFLESGAGADYNTADATLWFVDAVFRTLDEEWDEPFAQEAVGWLDSIYQAHVKGTLFGICADASDGLLRQGEPGVQLTWMDAKIGDWVVTPRHGKPVEINALWINALRIMEWLTKKLGGSAQKYKKAADKAQKSFDDKFWCAERGHFFDTVEPYDASLRPNQLIAMSLPFGPAFGERALEALRLCEWELITPKGVRTLGPKEPGYRGRFEGSLRELDSAYHTGTAWPWLLGQYAEALAKLKPDEAKLQALAAQMDEMVSEFGIGGVAEVYDGDEPQRPGGCPWQAWSIAAAIRIWKLAGRDI